jgi:vacuolar-type H+-ATPase subunit H
MKADLNLQTKKLELIQWLSTLEDLSVLNKIIDLKKQENKDWWEAISEDEKQSIEKGLQDANHGKLVSHSKAKKLYDKWL